MKVLRKLGTSEAGQLFQAEDIENLFDKMLGADFKPSLVDKALAKLWDNGLPGMMEVQELDALPAALIAMEPRLTLQQVDEACGKLEDLAILLLTTARAARHEVQESMADVGGATAACKVQGDQALAFLDDAAKGEFGFVALTPEEATEHAKLVRSMTGQSTKRGKSKAG